jgi:magnesium chelatase family protein
MLSRIKSCGISGIDGYIVEVETDINNGIPAFDIVGLGDTAVRESKERVRAAIKNAGYDFPVRRITVNLAPANLRKEGSSYDLPVAIGLAAASGQIDINELGKYIFAGELSLDGEIKPVCGILPMAECARKEGISNFILPLQNAYEAAIVSGISILPAANIKEVIGHINGLNKIKPCFLDITKVLEEDMTYESDFIDVKGQQSVKRALEIAAAGGHSCILMGSPGSGKTMLARRLPSILPPLSLEEAIEVTKINSITGLLCKGTSLVTKRPFRSPHHNIGGPSLIGGGKYPKPGEISLAHNGVLFLDEITEFRNNVLEMLRQPLEDGSVNISRLNASVIYPSKTTLICAANPCKCGMRLEKAGSCKCTEKQVKQYLYALSGPLMDTIGHIRKVKSIFR